MDFVAEIKRRLARYPELSYTETDHSIEVAAQSPSGFCVGLSIEPSEYTVYFDGWHQHFESPDDALEWFAMGLISGRCRVEVTYRGRMPVRFRLELRDGERWVRHSTTGLVLQPFWRPMRTAFLSNPERAPA